MHCPDSVRAISPHRDCRPGSRNQRARVLDGAHGSAVAIAQAGSNRSDRLLDGALRSANARDHRSVRRFRPVSQRGGSRGPWQRGRAAGTLAWRDRRQSRAHVRRRREQMDSGTVLLAGSSRKAVHLRGFRNRQDVRGQRLERQRNTACGAVRLVPVRDLG